jgi:hypothetical protein
MDAFFTAAASIRVGDGGMVNQYQSFPGFKNWLDPATQKLEADFPQDFWVVKTRNRIIHLVGNIGYETRRRVEARVTMKRREDGSIYAYRDDPPQDHRWRFAQSFHKKEGGKVIVDRCDEYLAALTRMINDWENRPGQHHDGFLIKE